MPTRRAFTLLELLLVLGIVALLVALLLPAAARARDAANSITCAAQLRQWASANLLYANAHHGYLPRRGQGVQPVTVVNRPEDWFNALPPMMRLKPYAQLAAENAPPKERDGSVFICPSAADPRTHPHFFPYAMNMRLSTWQTPTPDRITRVGPWSTLVFMTDAPGPYASTLPSPAKYSPVARHRGRLNVAYLDAHVVSYPAAEVGCNVGDPLLPHLRWTPNNATWSGPPQ